MSIFAVLAVDRAYLPRSAAMNMAMDEALLESASAPTIRFYRWDHPALSFGYFGKFAEVESFSSERDLVRRWTGGGIVLHGDDLTYAIVVPLNDPAFAESPVSIYAAVHRAIRDALAATGQRAELATVAAVGDRSYQMDSAIADRRYNQGTCFANPVHADVLVNGRKVAGAAQRRTRHGLLQQGSIQDVDLAEDFVEQFAQGLSREWTVRNLDAIILNRAREIAEQKYGAAAWLKRR